MNVITSTGLLINDSLLIGAASETISFNNNTYYQIQKTVSYRSAFS